MDTDVQTVNIENIISDWDKLCRICLTDQAILFPVFSIIELDEQYNMSFCEMLNTCSTLKVSTNDNFPQLICSLCITHMRHALEFRIKCQSSEMILTELLHKKNDLNTTVKCEVIEVKEPSAETNADYLYLAEAKLVTGVDENESPKKKSHPILPTKKENIESNSIILKKVHSCPICEESCSYRELQSHKKTHPNTCWKCNINFKSIEEYKEHLNEHKEKVCSECGKVLKNKELCCSQKIKPVRNKLNSVLSRIKKVHICPICHVSCKYIELGAHKRTHLNTCWNCNISFKNAEEHIEHLKEHDENVCSECGKVFRNKGLCKQHKIIHAKDKCLCTICGKKFSTPTNLAAHHRKHTEEPKRYECSYCGKKFADWSTRRYHIRNHHTLEKPFACDICNSRFANRSHLVGHMPTHSIERPFACTMCEAKFKQRSALNKHMFKHTGEKRVFCTVCNKGFVTNHNLKVHMVTHTGEKNFVCSVCNKGFSQAHVLRTHMNTHSDNACTRKTNIHGTP